jgi:hypothetical protein
LSCAGIIKKVIVDRMIDLVPCGDLVAVYRLVVLQTLLLKVNFVLKKNAVVLLESHQRWNLGRIIRSVIVPKNYLALFRRVISLLFLCLHTFGLYFCFGLSACESKSYFWAIGHSIFRISIFL